MRLFTILVWKMFTGFRGKLRRKMIGTWLLDTGSKLFGCLDKLGYSQEMIQWRRNTNRNLDVSFNSKPFSVLNIKVGRKAEGTEFCFEIDKDRLNGVKEVAYLNTDLPFPSSTEFHLDTENSSTGYTGNKLYECLDKLSYSSQEMIGCRRDTNINMAVSFDSETFSVINMTMGGRAEGPALYFESDADRLNEVKEVACVNPDLPCPSSTLFHPDRENSSTGYTGSKLFECLDKLGYSQEMIQCRRDTNRNMDVSFNSKTFSVMNITVGGRAEGTALYFESDTDRLYEVKEVACVNPDLPCLSSTVFHLDRKNCSPGYTRLKLVRMNTKYYREIEPFLVSDKEGIYLSNDYSPFEKNENMIDIHAEMVIEQDKRGPATAFGNSLIQYDYVLGLKCTCPDLLKMWAKRPRVYKWPDLDLVAQILALEGHVVPVADKDSKNPQTEWRICYTKAEHQLLLSFNEGQIKLYILLKLIAKSVLKPLCSEMSSYIMKNILFWMIESNTPESFNKSYLTDKLVDALVFLKECVASNELKSYMIPGRNLLQGRITTVEKDRLLKQLYILINEKQKMFKRCPKIYTALTKLENCPEELSKEADKRDKIETLILKQNVIFKEIERPGLPVETVRQRLQSDSHYRLYEEELFSLVVPDKEEIVQLGQNPTEIYRLRLSKILS